MWNFLLLLQNIQHAFLALDNAYTVNDVQTKLLEYLQYRFLPPIIASTI